MESENRYTIQSLDEYLHQGEPELQQRGGIWQTSIGLQQVDGLTPSEYLLQTARRHIEGEINLPQAKELIDSYYRTEEGRKQTANERTEEADKVSVRIAELLSEKTFAFTPAQYTTIHRRLFEGLFKFAGLLRDYNITKREWILAGDTVLYSSHELIAPTLDYDLTQERTFDYSTIGIDQSISHLARFCSGLWQIHAFGEGNTRTTAVFMIKYLRSLGFNVSNEPFAKHSRYFRNALVRANYNNLPENLQATTVYLERFFRNLILGEQNVLRNRELHINWQLVSHDEGAIQSAKPAPKCNNCTLEKSTKKSIRFYNDYEVRAVWDEENSKWWYSATDIVRAINEEEDYKKCRNYWKYLKGKMAKDGIQLVSATNHFKFQAPDGKQRAADALDDTCVQTLAKHYPNNRANAFLDWFFYSDNTLDGQSKKKAYTLVESGLLDSMKPGTIECLQQIHAYIFGGLYDFAGKIRTKTISKGGTIFCRAEYLMQNLETIEQMPQSTFDEIVDKYVEMNVAHPFMEGNGRSTRIWLDLIFKQSLKKCVDWSKIDKKDYLDAMHRSVTNATRIKSLLRQSMTDRINDREIFMKGIDYSYYYEQTD